MKNLFFLISTAVLVFFSAVIWGMVAYEIKDRNVIIPTRMVHLSTSLPSSTEEGVVSAPVQVMAPTQEIFEPIESFPQPSLLPPLLMTQTKLYSNEVWSDDVFNNDVFSSGPEAPLTAQFNLIPALDNPEFLRQTIPGTGNAAYFQDWSGNIWVWAHDGYADLDGDQYWTPLELEMFRFLFQGGRFRSEMGGELGIEETRVIMDQMLGKTFFLEQEGKTIKLLVTGTLQVPHERMGKAPGYEDSYPYLSRFGGEIKSSLDNAIEIDPSFIRYKTQRAYFFTACLRIWPGQEDIYAKHGGDRWSWGAWVLAMEPVP